jgi:hypothetical protein
MVEDRQVSLAPSSHPDDYPVFLAAMVDIFHA